MAIGSQKLVARRTLVAAGIVGSLVLLAGLVPTSLAQTEATRRATEATGGVAMIAPRVWSTTRALRAAAADPGRSVRTRRDLPLRTRVSGLASPSRRATNRAVRLPSRSAAAPSVLVTAAPKVTTQFAGIGEGDLGVPTEPPDPWVAVSATHVVQSTNGLVRISTRSGVRLADVPTWAMFGVLSSQDDADPRIIWDSYHGRWVGEILTFNADESQNYLIVAVSESADPMAGWDLIQFDSAAVFPDFPGIASSTDKIVVATNDYVANSFVGGEIDELSWAQLLAGGPVAFRYSSPDPSIFAPRPALVLSASADVHLIAEGPTSQLVYRKLSGAAQTVPIGAIHYADLSGDPQLILGGFQLPPAPHQPGSPATIVEAVDERPTDAVWRNGILWLVSTLPADLGMGVVDTVRVTRLLTTSGPDVTYDTAFGASTKDTFMGGVGLLADGTAVVTYNSSSVSQAVESAVFTIDGATDTPSAPLVLMDSDGSYVGTRWGDYQAVAADPFGGESAWLVSETSATDGSWRTHLARLTYDATPPPTVGTVTETVVAPSVLSSTVPVRFAWVPVVDAGSGVDHYRITMTDNTDPFNPASTTAVSTTPSIVRNLVIGRYYYVNVDAVDGAGNVGSGANNYGARVYLYQQTSASFSSGWTTSSGTSYSGGSTRYATVAGKTATLSFNGRSVSYVASTGPTRGSVKIYIDGIFKKTVSLYSTTPKSHQVLYAYGFSYIAPHKIKLVVVGTAHHPRVDIDAFVVLR